MKVSVIAAIGPNKEIGLNGLLPWHISSDLKHFKALTTGHTIIAGRVTYESYQKKPLPNRTNIVVTRSHDYKPEGTIVTHSLDDALRSVPSNETEAFIVGGAGLFAQALPLAVRLYITRVENYSGPADTFFPEINPDEWQEVSRQTPVQTEKDDYPFSFIVYDRKSP